ncbi:MAG: hypothetical protein M1812_003707 [Candelaria pacifica]|nr:MAG: hypothetical protein M1812_003707 [Candelaria pacifica]
MSSQTSFFTAQEMSSSQLSDPPSDLVPPSDLSYEETNQKPPNRYRAARQLPYQLKENCLIFFEEGLYSQGLTLLLNLLSAGTSTASSTGQPVPAFAPPHQHLSLAATLVVHPSLTTRASSNERIRASNTALRLLRLSNKLLGPVNANFATAFTFNNPGGLRRSTNNWRRVTDAESPSSNEDQDSVNNVLAKAGSLWTRAEDFWQVVGWAFNCSVLWPKRWARWKLWLEFMLDVLRDDWEERVRMNEEREEWDNEMDYLEESMIVKYLPSDFSRYGGNRRIVRAVFADGSPKCLNEFKEIFKNETTERTKKNSTKKLEVKVNVEEDIYADYMEAEEDSDDEETQTHEPAIASPSSDDSVYITPHNNRPTNKPSPIVPNGATLFGGMESLNLRQRFLALLSQTSASLPQTFTPLQTLYDLYVENIRPLPLATFSLLLTPSTPYLPPSALSSLSQLLLRSLLSSNAPLPSTLITLNTTTPNNTQIIANDELTQEILERCYLPYAANTKNVLDNTKVGLLVEGLLRLLARHEILVWTESLEFAVEEGVRNREMKVRDDGRRSRGGVGKGEEMAWLKGNRERMRAFGN